MFSIFIGYYWVIFLGVDYLFFGFLILLKVINYSICNNICLFYYCYFVDGINVEDI